jgi:Protein of unknown function (DUF2934)
MNSDDSQSRPNDIELIAYRLWEERGRPHGSPEEDWYRAELEVALPEELPVSSAAAMVKGQ